MSLIQDQSVGAWLPLSLRRAATTKIRASIEADVARQRRGAIVIVLPA
jgi:hypothetical protein